MSYNGSGTFQINTSGQPVVAGTVISSTAFNALTADLATGLSTAITKDGQTATTARIPFAQGINSSLTTDSSSTTTGSIITAGGVGIVKNLYVGANTNIAGTLGVTGVATFSAAPIYSSLTASSAVATDASKALVSVTNTGTGNNVLATSPTLVTPALGTPSALVLTNATGLPQAGLAAGVAGNGPAFSYYASAGTSITNVTFTKVLFATSEFDTASAVSSSTFTPTVAGYYQINASVFTSTNPSCERTLSVFKNGASFKNGQDFVAAIYGTTVNCIVYLNGSTDYVEIYAYQTSGGSLTTNAFAQQTYFQGFLARAA
jgi:hypothetical protein